MSRPSPAERFWQKVDVRADGCWEYRGKIARATGYGCFSIGYEHVYAHRFSWMLARGPIPDGLCVLHHCDNRPCVRPDHLFLGDRAANNADMHAKGRGYSKYRGVSACIHGHEYSPENTSYDKNGHRHCRACQRRWKRQRDARRRNALRSL